MSHGKDIADILAKSKSLLAQNFLWEPRIFDSLLGGDTFCVLPAAYMLLAHEPIVVASLILNVGDVVE